MSSQSLSQYLELTIRMQVFEFRLQFRAGPKNLEIAEITSNRIRKPGATRVSK